MKNQGNMKDNKLITEFMGYAEINEYTFSMGKNIGYYTSVQGRSFDSSWNLLMLVVQKIQKTKYSGFFKLNGLIEADIEKTYKSVVEFIKWYNKNQ